MTSGDPNCIETRSDERKQAISKLYYWIGLESLSLALANSNVSVYLISCAGHVSTTNRIYAHYSVKSYSLRQAIWDFVNCKDRIRVIEEFIELSDSSKCDPHLWKGSEIYPSLVNCKN